MWLEWFMAFFQIILIHFLIVLIYIIYIISLPLTLTVISCRLIKIFLSFSLFLKDEKKNFHLKRNAVHDNALRKEKKKHDLIEFDNKYAGGYYLE